MITNDIFSKACNEVLEILKNVKIEDYNKIPKDFIDNLKKNADIDYKINISPYKDFSELDLLPETIDLLAYIYRKFWCDELGKKEFDKFIQKNEKKFQEELRIKYKTDDIFKKQNTRLEQVEKEKSLIIKENNHSILKKIWYYIRKRII